MYVGIDWASEGHAVCVLDDAGHQDTTFQIAHTAEGSTTSWPACAATGPHHAAGGYRAPRRALVDRLLEAGHPVVPVQSNAIKAWRDAEVLSGARNDPGDAAVIAESPARGWAPARLGAGSG
jgi:Transposase